MNEAAAAGAKERDPLADVERQGPISWALHSIRTRYSLATAVFLLPALAMLYIGGRMLLEGVRGRAEEEAEEKRALGHGTLLLQGVATSIDALSVGFTIEEYPFSAALTESLIIGAVTLAICLCGLFLGRTIGRKLDRIAPILGGLILIGIGVEIFLTGIF